MKPHLLLVAYAFPPSGEIGARRALRFAEGLSANGWRVSVLTVDPRFYWVVDPSFVPRSPVYSVHTTTTLDPVTRLARRVRPRGDTASPGPAGGNGKPRTGTLRRIARALGRVWIPDSMIGWALPAFRAARSIDRDCPVDVVLSTAPPYSSHITAAMIATRLGAKLVLDYRDPWAIDREHAVGWLSERLSALLEAALLARADLALFTAPTARAAYAKRFSRMPATEILLNGFDAYLPGAPPRAGAPLVWTYAGSLYLGRTLAPVIRALARITPEKRARLRVIGGALAEDQHLASELGVMGHISWFGRVPFDQVAAELRSAHRLLAVISEIHPFSIPAKLFDYMAARRPILLLCDRAHAAAELLIGTPQHRVLAHSDEDGIAELMLDDANAVLRDGLPDVSPERTSKFEAAGQIRLLNGWLRALIR